MRADGLRTSNFSTLRWVARQNDCCQLKLAGPRRALQRQKRIHCNLAYSALACFRIGMSGSASFHKLKKSL